MAGKNVVNMSNEELVKRVVVLEEENTRLKITLQGFEDLVDRLSAFLVQIEDLVPTKLLGWFRFLIMGFVTMKAVIDLIQEFGLQLDAWKKAKADAAVTVPQLDKGISASYRVAAKV